MPVSEQTPSSQSFQEVAIPSDDSENYPDGGPLDIGRLDVNLKTTEQTISSQ